MQPENSTVAEQPAPGTPQPAACENCGAPLYGKYCYACGQPIHGLVRHFGSVMSDIADSVLNVDERLFRTLGPLYLRPGKLTLDYFAGKRARYVTPFRLVFFLAIIAFFSIQLAVRSGFAHVEHVQVPAAAGVPASSASAASGTQANNPPARGGIRFDDGGLLDRQSNPVRIGWLPDGANDWLNEMIGNARQQLHQMRSGSTESRREALRKFTLGMFSAAPSVLFVLLPIFALLLKIFYVFKKRLYMEHLILAMHSHAFLMFSMLVLVVLGSLRGWIVPHTAWMGVPFTLLNVAAWVWIFVYLWLTQKRVYRQGWFMTTLKYCCVGFCYSILLGFGMLFAAVMSLTGA